MSPLVWVPLVLAGILLVGGVGALKWAETPTGRAVLLALGVERMYGEVQAAVDQALAGTLDGYLIGPADASAAGPAPAGADYDWPASEFGPGAAVRCRQWVIPDERTFWSVQRRIQQALEPIGARVLWGERLVPEPTPRGQFTPSEELDLLRLDLGVRGKPTHTLVLRREGRSPGVRWGGGPGQTAWAGLRAAAQAPTVCLVIDDWGYHSTEATDVILDLPIPVTMAVLPGLAYSRQFALEATELVLPQEVLRPVSSPGQTAARGRAARLAAGCLVEVALGRTKARLSPRRREVILHLPMEPQGYPETNPGAGAILVGMSADRIEGILDRALASLPNVAGVNNHMGSAATADALTMERLMKALSERGFFFLDSLTTARSVAYAAAQKAGLPALKNRIFLDYDNESSTKIAANLATLVRSARAAGSAVGICHPHPATAEVLARELPRLQAEGVCFVTVSELLALRAGS